jgi:hypothetical protein
MRRFTISPLFVELMPTQLQEGVLYISEKYGTAIHRCCCGCGSKVVTPLSPVKWRLSKNGHLVTLHPSIGNWNFACRSHYWIRRNRIEWAESMTEHQIKRIQGRDQRDAQRYIERTNERKVISNRTEANQAEEKTGGELGLYGLWCLLKAWWNR